MRSTRQSLSAMPQVMLAFALPSSSRTVSKLQLIWFVLLVNLSVALHRGLLPPKRVQVCSALRTVDTCLDVQCCVSLTSLVSSTPIQTGADLLGVLPLTIVRADIGGTCVFGIGVLQTLAVTVGSPEEYVKLYPGDAQLRKPVA